MKQSNIDSASQTSVSSNGYYAYLITFLVLLSAFGSFVNDMYTPTLPDMVRSFHTTPSAVQLGLTFGMVGLGIGQMFFGPLSDRIGRKPILFITLVIFCAGAMCSVWSKTIHEFIMWRLVQGFGASGGYFLARTIPADLYQGRALAKVMALVGAINGFAPASAPVIGGFAARTIGWQGIFWILFGFGVLLILTSIFFKESLPDDRRAQGNFGTAYKNYLILIKNKPFMIHVILKGAALGIMFAYIASAPFIIQDHYGFTPLQYGLFMGFNVFFVAGGSVLAVRFRPLKKAAAIAGWGVMLAGIAEFFCFYYVDSIWAYEILTVIMLFFLGMIFTTGNTLAMNEGHKYAGDASAIVGLSGYVFGAVVSPLVGMGDILHPSAIVIISLSVITLIFARLSKRLPADLETT